jgi:hypothetical protein
MSIILQASDVTFRSLLFNGALQTVQLLGHPDLCAANYTTLRETILDTAKYILSADEHQQE